MEGAVAFVDVVSVGGTADFNDFGSEFVKDDGSDVIPGPVGAIDDDFETTQIH